MNTENTILICGFGVSGRAAAKLAAVSGGKVIAVDEKSTMDMHETADCLKAAGVHLEILFSWKEGRELPPCGTVIMSPGIRKNTALYQAAEKALIPGGKWFSELEFALNNVKSPFVAITGTNGKTTTTEITTALLRANGLHAESSGNIGNALSECVLETQKNNLECLVVETSSFQLETIQNFPCCPAAILNLGSDHIDRHGSLEEYARLKFKLFAASGKPQMRIMNSNLSPWKEKFLPNQTVTTFSAEDQNADFTLKGSEIFFRDRKIFDMSQAKIQGEHNVENIMAALGLLRAVCGEESLYKPETVQALCNFQCSPHRMELFAEFRGVKYINDSKATNPHAVNAAVKQFAQGQNLYLLLGGLDKGMDFSELEPSFPYIKQAFLIGSCREKIYKVLNGKVKCKLSNTFESAVRDACSAARAGDCVMLSPATASMDMFRNYAERGETFKLLVNQWLTVMKRGK